MKKYVVVKNLKRRYKVLLYLVLFFICFAFTIVALSELTNLDTLSVLHFIGILIIVTPIFTYALYSVLVKNWIVHEDYKKHYEK